MNLQLFINMSHTGNAFTREPLQHIVKNKSTTWLKPINCKPCWDKSFRNLLKFSILTIEEKYSLIYYRELIMLFGSPGNSFFNSFRFSLENIIKALSGRGIFFSSPFTYCTNKIYQSLIMILIIIRHDMKKQYLWMIFLPIKYIYI